HPHTSAGIRLGMISRDARGNRLQFSAHLFNRDPTLHLRETCEVKIAARILLLLELQRHPQIGRLRKTPTFRHHPDNSDALAVYGNNAANNVGIGPEMILPNLVAMQSHRCSTLLIFFGLKGSVEHGLDPEKRKCITRNELDL